MTGSRNKPVPDPASVPKRMPDRYSNANCGKVAAMAGRRHSGNGGKTVDFLGGSNDPHFCRIENDKMRASSLIDPDRKAKPFLSSVMRVEPAWIDYNGHLNMAYYNVLFDRATDLFWLKLGIGPDYMKARNGSTFTAECHLRYLREVRLDDPVQISIFLIAADEKRLHTFEELRHATEGWLSATSENMTLHVDMTARKVAPFPSDIRAHVQAVVENHSLVARPEGIGRRIAMPPITR